MYTTLPLRPTLLPVLYTEAGALVSEVPPADEVRFGFLLRELADVHTLPAADVHFAHSHAAHEVLVHAGVLRQPTITPEVRSAVFTKHTLAHVDGFSGAYYQVNTLQHMSEAAPDQRSRLSLTAYDITAEEHERLAQLYPADDLPGPSKSMFLAMNIGTALRDRAPNHAWQRTARPNDTLVFPNGYDARAASAPQALFLHEFRTITRAINPFARVRHADLSRIVETP